MANQEQEEIDPLRPRPLCERDTFPHRGRLTRGARVVNVARIESWQMKNSWGLTPPSSPALRAGHPPLLRNRFGESRAWLSGVCVMANTLMTNNGIL